MTGQQAPERAYGGWQPERVNFLFGLSGRRAAILATAVLALLLPVATTRLREATVAWPPAIALALAATVRFQGRTADEWAAGSLSYLAIRVQGQHRFAGGPYVPGHGTERTDGDAGGQLMELPGILAPLRLLAIPSGRGDLAVVHHAVDQTYTAVARIRAPGIALADSGRRDQRVDGWGALLAGLCTEGSPVIRIQALQRAVPEPGVLLRQWHHDHAIPVVQLDQVPLLGVGPALPALQVVLAEVLVQQCGVDSGEVAIDSPGGQPLVQVPAGGDVRVDRLLFVGAAVTVVDRAQVVLEFREGRLPVTQRDGGEGRAGITGIGRGGRP